MTTTEWFEEAIDTTPLWCPDCLALSRDFYTGECVNHDAWMECEDCGCFFPLVEGTFLPGTPARGPSYACAGEPGDPPEYYCPGCPE